MFTLDDPDGRWRIYLTAAATCASSFNRLGLVDELDVVALPFHRRPWLVIGADRYADACMRTTTLAERGWRGAIDQWSDNTDVLTAPPG
jgi:hypothetical protein